MRVGVEMKFARWNQMSPRQRMVEALRGNSSPSVGLEFNDGRSGASLGVIPMKGLGLALAPTGSTPGITYGSSTPRDLFPAPAPKTTAYLPSTTPTASTPTGGPTTTGGGGGTPQYYFGPSEPSDPTACRSNQIWDPEDQRCETPNPNDFFRPSSGRCPVGWSMIETGPNTGWCKNGARRMDIGPCQAGYDWNPITSRCEDRVPQGDSTKDFFYSVGPCPPGWDLIDGGTRSSGCKRNPPLTVGRAFNVDTLPGPQPLEQPQRIVMPPWHLRGPTLALAVGGGALFLFLLLRR